MIPAQDRPGAAPLSEGFEARSRAEVGAIPSLRGQVVAYAERVGASESVREKVRLAVSEAVTNSVVHAYADRPIGDVVVKACVGAGRQLVILVLDEGSGFRTAPVSPGLGVGLGLMAEMSDGLSIGTRDGRAGTSVTLHFRLDATPAPAALA